MYTRGIILLCILFLHACTLFDENKIPRNLIPGIEEGDTIVFISGDYSYSDTFEIVYSDFGFAPPGEEEIERYWLSYNTSNSFRKYFLVQIFSHAIGIPYYKHGEIVIYIDSVNQEDFSYGDVQYKNSYLYESILPGISDTVIDKLWYHGKEGILYYRYENGMEYFRKDIIENK